MPNNEKAAAVLFLRAQTPLHAGSGAPLGAIDLPIQREVHTQWPAIHSSGLKGVLRDAYRNALIERNKTDAKTANGNTETTAIFGPAKTPSPGEGHAGCLTVTDARILAFPVSCERGVFAWVTCSAVFDRLAQDMKVLGLNSTPQLDPCGNEIVVLGADSADVVLRDLEYTVYENTNAKTKLNEAAQWISKNACGVDQTANACGVDQTAPPASIFDPRVSLAQIPNDDFTYFVQYATEVVSRNALDEEKRTVKRGALFMQEFLPSETILYALLLADKPRKPANGLETGSSVMDKVCNMLGTGRIQIGGDQTTGKGLCQARIVAKGDLEAK